MKLNRAITRTAGISLAVVAVFAAAPVQATDEPKTSNRKFEQLDKNRDGFLTREELRHARDYGRAFGEADENRDGKLDAGECIKAEAIYDRIVAGRYVEDSVVTAKVKAALLKEPALKSLDVSVETLRGEVLLSGFVKDEGQKQRAMKAAGTVNGVVSVKDALVVR